MLLLEASSYLHLPLITSLLDLHPSGSWVGPWFPEGILLAPRSPQTKYSLRSLAFGYLSGLGPI